MKYRYILFLVAAFCSMTAISQTLNQAKKLYAEGQFEKALPVFLDNLKKNPKNASYNQWVGACLYETGRKEEAVKYLEFALSREVPDAARYLAQIALERMDYGRMDSYLAQFEESLDDEAALPENAAKGYRQLKKVSDMLNNVERIQIFDSLTVDKSDFFKYYKLSAETGSLNGTEVLPFHGTNAQAPVFMPQAKSRMIWAMPDSTGCNRLAETYKLADGKWEQLSFLGKDLNDNGDAGFPFVMADGTTVYYACNGSGSIGGYDIYMSRKDFTSGGYLQPLNIGMPYNSPYDDYMLVIDEMTGVGWWATDRNRIDGKITIYIFKRNDIRENYDRGSNVFSLAAVRSIKDSWDNGYDYDRLKDAIANISEEEKSPEPEFAFYVKNGVLYTRFTDFKSSEAESLMHKRVNLAGKISEINANLKDLRNRYAKANASGKARLAPEIRQTENEAVKDADELSRIDNAIRSIEIPLLKDFQND